MRNPRNTVLAAAGAILLLNACTVDPSTTQPTSSEGAATPADNASGPVPASAAHSGGDPGAPGAAPGERGLTCGVKSAALCTVGEPCSTHADCASDACAYDGKCVAGRSCTAHSGGDTCGAGETGEAGAQHVSCCEAAPLFGNLANVKLDKFLITAGRMRSFVERVNGDVRGFVHTLPASQWRPEYDDKLVPSTMAEANEQLGSFFDKKSCHPGDHTGRTYWTPAKPDDASDFTKDQLDEKALNCVTWHLVAAFCAWDGGRMATANEIRNGFTNGGKHAQPWLWKPDAEQYFQFNEFTQLAPQTAIFNHAFGYGFPNVPGLRRDGNGQPEDAAYHVAPPGRYPTSWNEHGHEMAGNLLTWNASGPFIFTRNYSWENHGGDDLSDSSWKDFQDEDAHLPNGYYAIGGRCAHD